MGKERTLKAASGTSLSKSGSRLLLNMSRPDWIRVGTFAGWLPKEYPKIAKPEDVVSVWDDDKTDAADRYTIVLEGGDYLSLSSNPEFGVSQFGHGIKDIPRNQDRSHLGKRIRFCDLPENVQQHAIARLRSYSHPDEEVLFRS